MGLDTVELVMNFEDEFQLSIPDADAERIQTAGQALDYIVKILRGRAKASVNHPCASAHRFRMFRDDLRCTFGAPHRSIRPSAAVGRVIPDGPLRALWGEFARRHGLPKPPFAFFPTWRFPANETTLGDLLRNSVRGDYCTDAGDVDLDRVWDKVREIISEQAGVAIDRIQPHTHFINDLNLG